MIHYEVQINRKKTKKRIAFYFLYGTSIPPLFFVYVLRVHGDVLFVVLFKNIEFCTDLDHCIFMIYFLSRCPVRVRRSELRTVRSVDHNLYLLSNLLLSFHYLNGKQQPETTTTTTTTTQRFGFNRNYQHRY